MSLVAVEFDSDGRAHRLIMTFGPQPEVLVHIAPCERHNNIIGALRSFGINPESDE